MLDARLCVLLPWLSLGTGQLLSPHTSDRHGCHEPGVSMEHLSARGSHLLLNASPPLLCAKMQNILIHVSLLHFFSFPCWIPRRQGIYGVSLLQPQRKPSQGQHHETGSSCQGGKERLLSAWRRRKSNQNPSKKIEI